MRIACPYQVDARANPETKLVDLDDPTGIALSLAACHALPEETPLLILADRLQELGDCREKRVRQFAQLVNQRPRIVPRFGRQSLVAAYHVTPGYETVLVTWLFLRWADDTEAILPIVKLAALAPLGLCRAFTFKPGDWPFVNTPEPRNDRVHQELWHSAYMLFWPPHSEAYGHEDAPRAQAMMSVHSGLLALRNATAAKNRLAGCFELVAGQRLRPNAVIQECRRVMGW